QMAPAMSQSYHQHILSPIPSKAKGSLVVNGSSGPNGTASTANTFGTNGTTNKPLSTSSTFTQEISRAMQASSSQQPKYASYPYVEDRFEQPPPPPPSPVGWSRS
ncbi:hypothetical protein AJ78_08472, partial [Emergomyces pasteurianus Ep9510]